MKAMYSSDPLGLTTDTNELLLSEQRTVVKCICKCNQSDLRVVFDPEPVVMSTTFCAWCFCARCYCSAALTHESHSPGASLNSSKGNSHHSKLCRFGVGEHCFTSKS